MRHED